MERPDLVALLKEQLAGWDAETPETGDITVDSLRKGAAASAAIGRVEMDALSDIERALDGVFPGEMRFSTREVAAKFDVNFDPEGTLVDSSTKAAIRAALLSNDSEEQE